MWIWVWVAIIIVSLVVQVVLGLRLWRSVRDLNAEMRALSLVSASLERELGRIGAPAVTVAVRPRHGTQLDTRA